MKPKVIELLRATRRRGLALLLGLFGLSGIEPAQALYQTGQVITNNFSFVARRSFTRPDGAVVPAGSRVYIRDFAGHIVFLEWFAVWCPYCVAAAPQVETGIVDWYAARGGNPHGVPVLHVAVNQEASPVWQNSTDNFINQHGFPIVVNDYDAAVVNPVRFMFQNSGQPIFVVINGVTNSPSHQPWQLLVNHLGYGQTQFSNTLAGFRAIMDTVQAPPPELAAPRRTGADFEFTIQTRSGLAYRVQVSTNLTHWTTLRTITGSVIPVLFRDTNVPPAGRFYRVVTP